jgi:DNA-binding SARP family transcriptional activator
MQRTNLLPASCRAATYTVDVLTGAVRRNAVALPLTDRQREIAVAIAVQPRAIPTGALGELLHPDRDAGKARKMVHVYVNRLRRSAGATFIVTQGGCYSLGPHVRVEPHRPEALSRSLGSASSLSAREAGSLRTVAAALRSQAPVTLRRFDWYRDMMLRMQLLGRGLAIALARKALAAGRAREAIDVARELTYEDPCDEEAWELVIRAELVLGERSAAVQGFRLYAAALARDLQTCPSPAISGLLRANP